MASNLPPILPSRISFRRYPVIAFLVVFSVAIIPSYATAGQIVINAVGDILLAGSGVKIYERYGYGYPFARVAGELRKGDLTVGNLEAPLTSSGIENTQKKYRYRMDVKAAAALRDAGFRVLTLANNHMMDFGEGALFETLMALERAGISYAGAGRNDAAARRFALLSCRDGNVAFLAYSCTYPTSFYAGIGEAGTARASLNVIRSDVAAASRSARHVVVSFHWGREGAWVPVAYQRALARATIDAGADIVLGHHPHVLQGVEWRGRGIIFYSLGNFVFGTLSTVADTSVIARIVLDETGVAGAEIVPLNVLNRQIRYQPAVLTGAGADKVAATINGRSTGMGSVIISRGGRYLIERTTAKAPVVTSALRRSDGVLR